MVTAPGKTIEKGTILLRDGLIVDVGAGRESAAGSARLGPCRQDDLPWLHRFLQPPRICPRRLQPEPLREDVDRDDPNAKPKEIPRESAKGTHAWNPRVTPERKAADYLKFDKKGDPEAARPRIHQRARRARPRHLPRHERADQSSGSRRRHDGGYRPRSRSTSLSISIAADRRRLSEFAHGLHRADSAELPRCVLVSGGAGRVSQESGDDGTTGSERQPGRARRAGATKTARSLRSGRRARSSPRLANRG